MLILMIVLLLIGRAAADRAQPRRPREGTRESHTAAERAAGVDVSISISIRMSMSMSTGRSLSIRIRISTCISNIIDKSRSLGTSRSENLWAEPLTAARHAAGGHTCTYEYACTLVCKRVYVWQPVSRIEQLVGLQL